jgi:uncharacterized protein (TIGR02145 family)
MKPTQKILALILVMSISLCLSQVKAQHSEFYGMTSKGGEYDAGTIFKTDGSGNNFTSIYDFVAYEGMGVPSALCQAVNGKLYGLTRGDIPGNGEPNNFGVLFEWDPATNNYIKMLDFNGANGAIPYGSLVQAANGKLYGMTTQGGTANGGVIFEWDPVFKVYSKILDCDVEKGYIPHGSLVVASNGMLYGMISNGGKYGAGVIFEVDPNTDTYAKKFDFRWIEDGARPFGSLVEANDGMLYGMTRSGGTHGKGVIFKWNPISDTYTKIHEFNKMEDGMEPRGSLVQANNGKLYGIASGGIYGFNTMESRITYGVLFELDPITNSYSKKLDFNGIDIVGNPQGSLILANNGKLYGGSNYVLFEWNPITDTYTKISDQGGSLTQADNGKIYGTYWGIEPAKSNVIFEFDPATNIYVKKLNFNWAENGKCPYGNLVQADNKKLYGTAVLGGAADYGVLLEWDPQNSTLTKKFDFDINATGYEPYGSLIFARNGKLYGMANMSGHGAGGVLYEWHPVTNTYTIKLVLDWRTMGGLPNGSLIQADNDKLYGMTSKGGWLNYGLLFEWDPVSEAYSRKLEFDGGGYGRNPQGSLIQANNGKLYGMTEYGGINDLGVLFEWDLVNDTCIKKVDFNGAENGRFPVGSLTQNNNGKLYGMTQNGGVNDYGVLFEWDPYTNAFIKLLDFNGTEKGSIPKGSLLQAQNGNLYGMTSSGGAHDDGVLFEWNTITSIYTKKLDFNKEDGRAPLGSLIEINYPSINDTTVNLLKGLVAYYPFNGNAHDESGNGHHGTSNGGTLTQDRFGKPKGAYNFTGENNTLFFSGFQLKDPILTVCSWIKITDESIDTVLLSESSVLRFLLRLVNLRYQVELSSGGKQVILSDENGIFEIDPQNPRFDFLMLSYDGTQIKFRINDQEVAYKNMDGTFLKPLFPLTMSHDINYSFHGLLDEIRIYNRLFSDTERHYLMTDTYKTTPTVSTDSVTNIGNDRATIHGSIKFDEGKDLFRFGACWGTSPNPDTANLQLLNYLIINDTVTHVTLTGLLPNTTYYVRMIAMKESGISYYNELSFTTMPEVDDSSVIDVEGNVYKTIKIGSQTWMAENLKTTKLRDGTDIPVLWNNLEWLVLKSPACCWSDKNTYGALYNWYAVNTEKLCPVGWHVSTDNEWLQLEEYVGGEDVAGGKLKEKGVIHWQGPNTGGTDEYGFAALPGGDRDAGNGMILQMGSSGYWWSATSMWSYWMEYDFEQVNRFNNTGGESNGFSVRCVMDKEDSVDQVDLHKGLVAYYPFNGNANDESGNGHDGIVHKATLTNDRFGNQKSAYFFNNMSMITVEGFNIPSLATTIAFWVKVESNDIVDEFISKHCVQGDVEILMRVYYKQYKIEWNIGGTYFTLSDDNNIFPVDSDNPRFDFLVLTYDGQQACFYINNIKVSSLNISGPIVNNDLPMTFGRYACGELDYLDGVIDDVRIYNRPLNIYEIKSLYNENDHYNNISISTPDINTYSNSNLEVAVNANNLKSSDNIISYQFDFNYDPQKLHFLNFEIDNTLSENGSVQVNPGNNKLSLAWAGEAPLADSGTLIKLRFSALESGIVTPVLSNFLVNTDTVKNIINGTITIYNTYGDVDANGNVQAYDAALALQYSVGLDPLSDIDPLPWENWRVTSANVDGQDAVSAYDASLMLQYTVGLIHSFPVQGLKKSTYVPLSDIDVSVEDGTILFRSSGNLCGLNLSVEGNAEELGAPQAMNAHMLMATNISSSAYSVGLATAYPVSENEVILKIPLIEPITHPVRLTMKINNRLKQIELGAPTETVDPLSSNIEMYPNPANTILYFRNLPGETFISIYDMQGRKVTTGIIEDNRVDISNLDYGLYTVHINVNKNITILKLVKQ